MINAQAVTGSVGFHEQRKLELWHSLANLIDGLGDDKCRHGHTLRLRDQFHQVFGRVIEHQSGPGIRHMQLFEGHDDIDGGGVRVQVTFAQIHVDIKALFLEVAELPER